MIIVVKTNNGDSVFCTKGDKIGKIEDCYGTFLLI